MAWRVLLMGCVTGALISGMLVILSLIAFALSAAMDSTGSCRHSDLWWYVVVMCPLHMLAACGLLWYAYWDEEIEHARQTRYDAIVAARTASLDVEAGTARRPSKHGESSPSRERRAQRVRNGDQQLLSSIGSASGAAADRELIRERASLPFALSVWVRSQPFCVLSVLIVFGWCYSLAALAFIPSTADSLHPSATALCTQHAPALLGVAELDMVVGIGEPLIALAVIVYYEFSFGGICSPPNSDI